MKMNRFSRYIPWILVGFLFLGLTACASKEEKRDAYMKKGEVLLGEEDYTRAKLEFQNSLKIYPDYAPAYHKLGYCELKLENFRKAYGYFNKAVDLDPTLWEAQLSLAEMLLAGNQNEQASEKISLVLDNNPENARAHLLNSMLLIRQEKLTRAEETLKDVLQKDPGMVDAYIMLARLMESQSRPNEAEALLKKGLSSTENNPSLMIHIANLYERQKQLSSTESTYKSLVSYYPDENEYVLRLAKFYERSDMAEKAEAVYQNMIEKEPETVAHRAQLTYFYETQQEREKAIRTIETAIADLPKELRLQLLLAEIYTRDEQIDKALVTYQRLVKNHDPSPEAITARNAIARIYYFQKETDLAMKELEIILAENPRDFDAHFLKGTILLSQGKGMDAVNEFRVVVEEEPDNPNGYVQLARGHLLNKDKALAINNLKKAVEAAPRHQQSLDLLLSVLVNDKAYDEATYILKDIVKKDAEHIVAMSRLGDIQMMQGNIDMARQTYEKLKKAAPDNPKGFVKMSAVYRAEKNMEGALAELNKALDRQPLNMKILSMIIRQHLAMGQPARAITACRDHIQQVPDREAQIQLMISRIYGGQKEFDKAEAAIKKSIDLAPKAPTPYATLGRLYSQLGKVDQGIAEFKTALEQQPDNAQLMFPIAILYTQKKDYENAIAWYEKTIDTTPDFIPAINNLAYLYADNRPTPENLTAALALIDTIPEKTRNDSIQDTLGWVYYQQGKYAKAGEIYDNLKDTEDKPAIVRLHEGLTAYKLNHIAEARAELEKALKDAGLSEEERKMAEAALENL
ncbi:MAG: tetratricopeptide repeat protein [Thermodesulfobacteriota bacterium]|nr:tetratricopeptide repeat protein [Thermodesulfobacteriota bacterium]